MHKKECISGTRGLGALFRILFTIVRHGFLNFALQAACIYLHTNPRKGGRRRESGRSKASHVDSSEDSCEFGSSLPSAVSDHDKALDNEDVSVFLAGNSLNDAKRHYAWLLDRLDKNIDPKKRKDILDSLVEEFREWMEENSYLIFEVKRWRKKGRK
jgi:hypothetical protein